MCQAPKEWQLAVLLLVFKPRPTAAQEACMRSVPALEASEEGLPIFSHFRFLQTLVATRLYLNRYPPHGRPPPQQRLFSVCRSCVLINHMFLVSPYACTQYPCIGNLEFHHHSSRRVSEHHYGRKFGVSVEAVSRRTYGPPSLCGRTR